MTNTLEADSAIPDLVADRPVAEGPPVDTAVAHTLSVAELEDQLCTLYGQLAAGEAEFLRLLAEFDEREGWGGWGVRSCAHWLSLRCGMRLGAARERVRVAKALTRLPLVRSTFAAGQLSYCKVRALTRVATTATEADLVEVARGATGAQLERIVRTWAALLTPEMSASRNLRRSCTRREQPDGSVIFTVRLAPEDAAVLDSAIAAARAVTDDEQGQPRETPEEKQLAAELTVEPPFVRATADAVVLLAESFLTPSAVAGDAAGAEPRIVVHADADWLLADPDVTADPAAPTTPPFPVAAPPTVELQARALPTQRAHVDGGPPLSRAVVLRLLCEASVAVMTHAADGQPLDLGRTRRNASAKQRAALHARDGTCRFPGCTQRHRLIPHHVRWWSMGGPTDLDNLVLLCRAHHRAVHDVGYTIASRGRGDFVFFRPDGRPLPPPGPSRPSSHDVARPGLTQGWDTAEPITADTISPTWGGERLDLRMLVDGLAQQYLAA